MSNNKKRSTTASKKTNNKTNTGKRTNKSKRANTKSRKGKNSKNTNQDTDFFIKETLFVLFMAFSIFMLVSNFGKAGKVGKIVSDFAFGTFGMTEYILPFVIFFGAMFCIANLGDKRAILKIVSAVLLLLCICSTAQLVSKSYIINSSPNEYYDYAIINHTSGGVVGGMICKWLTIAFGRLGTYIAVTAIAIISIVLFTEKSFYVKVKRGSDRVYETAKAGNERYKEHLEERQQKNLERRLNKKAEGVSVNTLIPKKTDKKKEDIHEITMEDYKENTKADNEEADISMLTIERSDSPLIIENFEDVNDEANDNDSYDYNEEFNVPPFTEEILNEENVAKADIEPERAATMEDKPSDKVKPLSSKAAPKPDNNAFNAMDLKADNGNEAEKKYEFPPIELLKAGERGNQGESDRHLKETAAKLQQTLQNFGVRVNITNISCGPTVTRYELQPEQGVKVSKIVGLSDDIKLNLAAADIRIEAPIPGKAAIGIEVPNKTNSIVMLRDLLESEAFRKHPSSIAFAAGKDLSGQVVVTDIAKMPHLLIAGATGSGKSVCINTIIMSILYKANPEDVKLIMIDPKVVELSVYNGIPHLMIPVVTDPKKASGALNWAVMEMTDRYKKFSDLNVRDLKGYNEKIASIDDIEDENKPVKMPQIVIIVDELADLMMVAPGEVEDAICRLAQLARAAGIHLIIATQRPSVNVITGLIKANMPSRIAFAVSSAIDSRTILDSGGAEKLLGKGDMLFSPQGYPKPARVQGAFVSDNEVTNVVEFLSRQAGKTPYSIEVEEKINTAQSVSAQMSEASNGPDRDAYFVDAGKFCIEKDKASIGMLQRVFKIGFNRAARIMDQLCEAGVVSEEDGTKPRKVLMSLEEFEEFVDEYV